MNKFPASLRSDFSHCRFAPVWVSICFGIDGDFSGICNHELSAANKFCHPYKVLAWCETELDLNVMKKLKRVAAEGVGAVTGCFYEIAHVALMKS
jgi:hypothetical protein